MRTYAILNQKGGCSKSTTAANLGAGLARAGRAVLAVDLDPQGGLTSSLLGARARDVKAGTYEALTGRAKAAEVIIEARPGLRLIPATVNLAAAELELAAVPGRERILADVLGDIRGADLALIDCGPSLGLLSVLALGAARGVLVPVLAEYLAVAAVGRLVETIDRIREGVNPRLELAGVIICRFDERRILNREAAEDLRRHFGDRVYRTVIRENIAVAEAPGFGQTIFEYRPASHGRGLPKIDPRIYEERTWLKREWARARLTF